MSTAAAAATTAESRDPRRGSVQKPAATPSQDNHLKYQHESLGAPIADSPAADYAPSPNTSSAALNRANQMRIQSLLRQLLISNQSANATDDELVRIDILRMLRKTLREIDYQLSWLTQVDLLETLERILVTHDETAKSIQQDNSRQQLQADRNGRETPTWRLVHDTTQLLLEAMPRLGHEINFDIIESIVPIVVENLGHQRSEVRRTSLLLLNTLLRESPNNFQPILRLFIDYGLNNYRNQQAQRGSILSLPLLMSQNIVEREDLLPLIRCLSVLLIDDSEKNEQLFYSLYLALQRLHLMMGDQRFTHLMSFCDPDAIQLYRQAASRHNSLVVGSGGVNQQSRGDFLNQQEPPQSPASSEPSSSQISVIQMERNEVTKTGPETVKPVEQQQSRHQQHVTFENDDADEADNEQHSNVPDEQPLEEARPISVSSLSNGSMGSSESLDADRPIRQNQQRQQSQWSSDVSSTCSSDAHLVNPAHYMTPAALEGNPLENYEQIHHIDHSNVTSLAINDFGPICNTPTMEVNPKLNYLTTIRGFGGGGGGGGGGFSGSYLMSSNSPMSPNGGGGLILTDESLSRNELKFGILPRQLITITLNGALRSTDRYEAMQELMCIVRESPINHLAILMTYFDSFLEQFISKLLLHTPSTKQQQHSLTGASPQPNLKLTLSAIDMLETIVVKTKVSTMQYIRPIVSLLLKSLGSHNTSSQTTSNSSVSLLRENVCRVLHKMMAYLPPQHVIDAIFEHKHHKSALVREESINRVTAAILDYDKNEFNLTRLCYHVLPMLADSDQNVRMASLECIATLAHILGPDRIGSLLTAAEAVQTNCDYDGLLVAIHARLLRHTLPRLCQSNGMIKYVIKPFLYGAQAQLASATSSLVDTGDPDHASKQQQAVAADIRWVLETPSSHQHSSGPYYNPHSHPHQRKHSQPDHRQGPTDVDSDHHQHHRLGVYSPPNVAERRRRSSVGFVKHVEEIEDQSHHEHHHARHSVSQQQQQQRDSSEMQTKARPSCSSQQKKLRKRNNSSRDSTSELIQTTDDQRHEAQSDIDLNREPSEMTVVKDVDSEPNQAASRRKSCTNQQEERRNQTKQRLSGECADNPIGSQQESNEQPNLNTNSLSDFGPICSDVANFKPDVKVANARMMYLEKRSNSQDSLSSTDTNKLLFQYYLGKFKQSLASSPVGQVDQYNRQIILPSDSIIYADVSEAYALSRYQSRYQQTSFELPQHFRTDSNGAGVVVDDGDSSPVGGRIVPQSKRNSGESKPIIDKQQDRNLRRQSVNLSSQQSTPKSSMSAIQRESTIVDNASSTASIMRQSSSQLNAPNTLRRQTSMAAEDDREAVNDNENENDNDNENDNENGNYNTETNQASPRQGSGERDVSERSISHRSDSKRQQSRRKSANQSSSLSSGRPQTSCSSPKQVANTPPTAGSLNRNESDTTVSSMSTSENVPLNDTNGHEQLQQHQQSRLNRSSTRNRMISDQNNSSDARQMRRRASRSQPPPVSQSNSQYELENEPTCQTPTQIQTTSQIDESNPLDKSSEHSAASGSDSLRRTRQRDDSRSDRRQLKPKTSVQGRRAVSVSPSLSNSVNIRHILENVAELEGKFADSSLAFKVAMDALDSPCWSTKVEGILALIRLACHHQAQLLQTPSRLHEVILKLNHEIGNLRSTVARSAIFALGDFCTKLKRFIEPEMDLIVKALLQKSTENTAFIRDDIRRALGEMVNSLTPWRLANSLIANGAQHKSANVRKMASQFVAQLVVERLGPAKCLVGSREISSTLLPAACKFAQDNTPQTRYYGRLILSRLMHHNSFDRLLRRHVTSSIYRSTVGIVESIKRRGPGELPQTDSW